MNTCTCIYMYISDICTTCTCSTCSSVLVLLCYYRHQNYYLRLITLVLIRGNDKIALFVLKWVNPTNAVLSPKSTALKVKRLNSHGTKFKMKYVDLEVQKYQSFLKPMCNEALTLFNKQKNTRSTPIKMILQCKTAPDYKRFISIEKNTIQRI